MEDMHSLLDPIVPPKQRFGRKYIPNLGAITLILSGNIGIGVLTLPKAISNAGLIGGVLGLICIGFICIYCMNMLVKASYEALKRRPHLEFVDYGETAEAAFEDAGGRWRSSADAFKKLLNIFLCANQIGSNAVYVLFIAQNIKPLIVHYSGSLMESLDYRYYILMVLPFMLIMCSVRTLKYMSVFSAACNIIQCVGLGIVFSYIFRQDMPASSSLPWFGTADKLPLFFGTAIFAIEGISVVLPIENQMKYPRDMLGVTGVLNTSMILVLVLYIAMGFYGYLKFGDSIQASITYNLPPTELAGQITLCLYSMAIFFSYSLQFYVVIDIIKKNILEKKWSGRSLIIADMAVRVMVNITTFALAATVPWLDLFVSLLGAVKMSVLSLMAPAIIDTASNWKNLGPCNYKLLKNGLIFVFGLLGCVFGTYVSLRGIINNFTA